MSQPKEISPRDAAALVEKGALLVDVREAAERDAGVIPRAAHAPLSNLTECKIPAAPGQRVIFHCRGGGRTNANAAALAAKVGGCEAFLLKGGIDAWRAAGLPTDKPK